jgi:hypothetical protein
MNKVIGISYKTLRFFFFINLYSHVGGDGNRHASIIRVVMKLKNAQSRRKLVA